MKPLFRLCLLAACLASGALAAAEPVLGTFPLDPVSLLRDRKEAPGKEDLAVTHASFRYLFASPETRAAFLANPSAYEIQLGGACGRMGALSGTGRTAIHAVHDGRLYLFASEGCRRGFLADPSRVLEPQEDPRREEADARARERGKQLLEQAIRWLGGADRVDGAILRTERVQTVPFEGKDHRMGDIVILAPGGRMRAEHTWDEQRWLRVLTEKDAFFVDAATGVRSMQPSQRRSMERQQQRELLGLLQARGGRDFSAARAGAPAADGAETVHVRCREMNHTLAIDPATGRVLTHAFASWGPGGIIAAVERTYTRWQEFSGLRLPVAWENRYDEKPGRPTDLLAAEYRIEVLDRVPEGSFARPK